MKKHNNPHDALRHHVTGAIERGEATAIAGQPLTMAAAIIRSMTVQRATEILDGRQEWREPLEYLEAALYVSLHEALCRPLMAASLYRVAIMLADYAVEQGEAAACRLIERARGAWPASCNYPR